MKLFSAFLIICVISAIPAFSQVAVTTDGSSPDASSILDIKSTTKGLLIPRMTTTQRSSIASPAEGLMVFDMDLNSFCFYRSGTWRQAPGLTIGSGSAGQVAYFGSTGTLTGNNNLFWDNVNTRLGIGTATPNQQLEITGALRIPVTSSASTGVIYKGTERFLHDYAGVSLGCNTFLGIKSGNFTMAGTGTQTCYNTAIGYQSLSALTTGSENSVMGYNALNSNTSGVSNAGIGVHALYLNTSGSNNVAIGKETTFFNTTGSYNTVVGNQAGKGLTGNSYSNNALFGYQAGFGLTTGSQNILLGYQAGSNITSGSNNIIIGYTTSAPSATGNNQVVIGSQNLFYGDLTNNRVGIGTVTPGQKLEVNGNIAIPATSLTAGVVYSGTNRFLHNFGTQNVFLGKLSGNLTLSGSVNNTAVGDSTLISISTGDYNTAIGTSVLRAVNSGNANTAAGYLALGQSNGNYNTGIGYYSLYSISTGDSNTAIGSASMASLTSGSRNTALGYGSGPSGIRSNTISIGYDAQADADNQVRLGNNSVQELYCMGAYIGTVGTTNVDLFADNNGKIGYVASSARYKTNIQNMEDVGWLYDLRPVNFTYKTDISRKKQYGLIAEEVELVNPEFVHYNSQGQVETVSYSQLISPMLKAIQDQQEEIEALQSQVEQMMKRIEELERKQDLSQE